MRVMAWIVQACRVAQTPNEVYSRYSEFVADTGSRMLEESFKRRVRDVMYNVAGAYEETQGEDTPPRIMTTADGPNLNIVSESSSIRTLDELLAYCKVDLSTWKVRKHIVNSWGASNNENFQVKAWLEPKDPEVDPRAEIEQMLEEARVYMPKYPDWTPKEHTESGNLLEIALFDHHFGQLSWGRETRGENYDTGIARRLAIDAITYILERASKYNVDRIVLVVGNDFFNVNSQLNTTAAGTPQAEDGRWKKTFVRGRRLWTEIIELCLTIAPVDVVGILGNHDEERSFYLIDSLSCWFANHSSVSIDNGPEDRKYYRWGNCLIGFTHGHKERKGAGVLVNLMATEKPILWSETVYREWHKGHFHGTRGVAVQFLDEEFGVRERVLPSLVSLDDYHAGKGYSHLRESTGLIWNKEKGNTDIIMYHPN